MKAVTRNKNSDKAKQLSALKDCSVVEADLEDKKSVDAKNSYGAFFVTDFSGNFSYSEFIKSLIDP